MDKLRPTQAGSTLKGSGIRHFFVCVIAAILVLATGILFYLWRRPEPTWNGRRLSRWLYDLRPYSQLSGPAQDRVEAAIRAVGTNGIPLMMEWISSGDNGLKKAVYDLLPRDLKRRAKFEWAFDREWGAARALGVLGTNAGPAVPELSRLLGSGKRGRPAAAAMAGIGMPAFSVLTNMLLHEDTAMDASYGLTKFGDSALPTLIYALTNTNRIVHQAAVAGVRFCVFNEYAWSNADRLSASSLQFETHAMGLAVAAYQGRETSLLAQAFARCSDTTKQEVAAAVLRVKQGMGL